MADPTFFTQTTLGVALWPVLVRYSRARCSNCRQRRILYALEVYAGTNQEAVYTTVKLCANCSGIH
jgi:hypothetical protein